MIVSDEKIFRNPFRQMKGFNLIPYQFNINHYIIRQLWDKYIKKSGIHRLYLPSEIHRLHFESQLVKLIKSGEIVVHVKDVNAFVPSELKEVVIYE